MIDNLKISRELEYLKPYFLGVFARNLLPNLNNIKNKQFTSCIINTDTSNLPGKHWIAIYFGFDNKIYYFDPLALPPIDDVCEWLKKSIYDDDFTILFSKTSVQNIFSSFCGHHCIYFIKHFGVHAINDSIFI